MLLPGLELYYRAYLDLVTCRMPTMGGLGPIPWTAVEEYVDRMGVYGEDREVFSVLLRSLEAAHNDHMDKARSRQEAQAQRKANNNSRLRKK